MNERFFSNIDRNIFRDKNVKIEEANLARAEKMLGSRIKLEDFLDVPGYDRAAVLRDITEVTRLEKKYAEEGEGSGSLSIKFEAILNQQAETNNWLGENAETIIPSKFDDIKNGVDTLVKFSDENGEALYLAIDVSSADSTEKIEGKLKPIKKQIQSGEGTSMRYVETDDYKGRLKNIPKVIIWADKDTIKEIIDLWSQKKNKELANHPIQMLVLYQAKRQLETFKEEAEENNQAELALKHQKIFSIINTILSEKEKQMQTDKRGNIAFTHVDELMEEFKKLP